MSKRRGPEYSKTGNKSVELHNKNGVDDTGQSSKRRLLIDAIGVSSPPRYKYSKNTTYHRIVPLVRPIWPCRHCPPSQTFSDGRGLQQHNTITVATNTNNDRRLPVSLVFLKLQAKWRARHTTRIRGFPCTGRGTCAVQFLALNLKCDGDDGDFKWGRFVGLTFSLSSY